MITWIRFAQTLAAASLLTVTLGLHADQAPGPAVAHSPARNQKSVGFCWAFTLTGLIEGERMRLGTAPQVRLSAEYLGFYHMYFEIKNHISWFRVIARRLKNGGIDHGNGSVEDAYERIFVHNHFFTPAEGSDEGVSLKELALVGAVPNTVYSVSFNDAEEAALSASIKKFILNNLFDERKLDTYETSNDADFNEKLYQDFSRAFGSKPPRPTDTFTYRGQSYSSQDFLSGFLAFNPSDYVEITSKPSTFARDLNLVQAVLKQGIAVPIGFTVWKDKDSKGNSVGDSIIPDGEFSVKDCPGGYCTKEDAGHETLGVNWLENKSGVLTAIIVKSSWGLTGRNDRGKETDVNSDKGFYIVDSDYLLDSLTSKDPWDFVVPKAFAP